jgi:aspartyl-tRNA(Asn)/glutamyl-tRNA(Gln) amidotransferase subunit A
VCLVTAIQLGLALNSGETSSVALINAALNQIAQKDWQLRAFIEVAFSNARADAKASDARRLAGKSLSPLDGVPIAIKGNIALQGIATTDGTRAFTHRIATQDAFVVTCLRSAGAVIVGTLNMHEGALGATTDNQFWGQCQNPLALGYTPGGSSGGSAASVAAGIVPITLGTDTMGSVRIPAAYCGLWGLKPTHGLISNGGLSNLSWSLDTIGPIATSSDDIAIALSILAAPDPNCIDSRPAPTGWTANHPAPNLQDIVLGVPEYDALAPCEPEIKATFESMLSRARNAGIQLVPIEILKWESSRLRRAGLLVSEAEAGHILGQSLDADPTGFSDDFRAMISYGRTVSGSKVAAAYRYLAEVRFSVRQTLNTMHAIILPTAPQRAFLHGAEVPASQADFTVLANAAGLPALAFPIPAIDKGLPASVQLIGNAFSDGELIALGKVLSQINQL